MRYVMAFIGSILIMGSIGGLENDTLNILSSLRMIVIGGMLVYGCYIICKISKYKRKR